MRHPLSPAASIAIAVALAAGAASAAACKDNGDFYQSLPAVIGSEDQMGRFPYVLQCDTVFVRKGVTTTVHPGTLLHFAKPTLYSVIKVEGTLVLKGTKGSYVTVSGSLDSSKGTKEPGSRTWGGIEVSEGGRLEVEYAGFMGAPTPITTFSRQVKVVNSWFRGSSGIILPDGTLYSMDSKWHAINQLDLADRRRPAAAAGKARPSEAISEAEKAALLGKKDRGFWTWPKVAGGVAALAVVGAGAYYFAPGSEAEAPGTTGPPGGPPKRSTVPKVPSLDDIPVD
jgi:hypothetical protein